MNSMNIDELPTTSHILIQTVISRALGCFAHSNVYTNDFSSIKSAMATVDHEEQQCEYNVAREIS